jgi:hypothetical protein
MAVVSPPATKRSAHRSIASASTWFGSAPNIARRHAKQRRAVIVLDADG